MAEEIVAGADADAMVHQNVTTPLRLQLPLHLHLA
jgi:hypothetical protein